MSRIDVAPVWDLLELARDQILKIYAEPIDVKTKADRSPVTEADLVSNDILTEGLSRLGMGPVVSEEQTYAVQSGDYWLIDPLDGTKDFINRTDQFAINVAYMSDSQPIWGAIHAPVSNEFTWAERGHGAHFGEDRLPERTLAQPSRGAVSMFHPHAATELFHEQNGITESIKIGSSLKFVRFAQGEVDVYLRLNPTSEWDTAAGHVIAGEVGGVLFNLDSGQELEYNKPNPLNPSFLLGLKGSAWTFQGHQLTL